MALAKKSTPGLFFQSRSPLGLINLSILTLFHNSAFEQLSLNLKSVSEFAGICGVHCLTECVLRLEGKVSCLFINTKGNKTKNK
jgi:hypothetical protein